MGSKLTLSIDESIIVKGKEYAKEKGFSLSEMIENYLKILTSDKNISKKSFTPIVNSLRGSFKVDEDFNYKDELVKSLSEKHLNG